MFEYFIVFLAGAFCLRIFQFILSISPNYYIFKHAEYTVLRVLAELHVQKLSALKILELMYAESERTNEYYNVEYAVNNRYDGIINTTIKSMKNQLPYKTKYDTLNEAMETFIEENRNGKR